MDVSGVGVKSSVAPDDWASVNGLVVETADVKVGTVLGSGRVARFDVSCVCPSCVVG